MASYEINMEGIKALFSDPVGPVARILEHKCLNVEGIMKTLLLIPGSGRTYTQWVYTRKPGAPPGTPGRLGFYGSRPPHTASAPGMPPASDTGQLLASIGHKLDENEEGVVIGRVYADKAYALFLEHGTRYKHGTPAIYATGTRGRCQAAMRKSLGASRICASCGELFFGAPTELAKLRRCPGCRPKPNPVIKVCSQCGITFKVIPSKAARYRFCSLACRETAGAAVRLRWECEHCGKEVTRAPSQYRGRWCSLRCSRASRTVSAVCGFCGVKYSVPRHRMTQSRRCCSNRCAIRLRMEEGPGPAYIANKRRTGYRTDIEKAAERVLRRRGFKYEFEYKVGRYSVDFALLRRRIALECDGWRHTDPERDAKRDAYLITRGWTPVHIPGPALLADAEAAIREALAHV